MTDTGDQYRVPASVAILGIGFLWGAAYPAIEIVVAQLPPLGAAGIRYAASGGIILAYAALTTDHLLPRTRRELFGIVIIGGFMFGGFQAGLFLGTQYVSGAVAAVVVTMSPVVAALVSVPLLGESRGLLDGCGFILGLAGVIIISQPPLGTSAISSTAIGVGFVFFGTILFAVGSITVQLFDKELPAEILQGWAMLIGAGLLFWGALLRGEAIPAARSLSLEAIVALLYITLIAGAGGYLFYFQLVRRVGATETTLVAYIEPISATLISLAFLGQTIESTTVVGFFAVMLGFTFVSRDTIRNTLKEQRVACGE